MAVRSLKNSTIESFENYSSSMNAGYDFNDFELIESVFVASSASSVTFNNLNQYATDYKHLQIRLTGRSDEAGSSNARDLRIRANADTGSNYSSHRLRGDGAGVYSDASTSQTAIFGAALFPRPSNPTTEYGAGVIDLLDFASTTKNKTFRFLTGLKPTGEDQIVLGGGAWLSTTAVASITIFANSGNLATGSRFSLYGIR